MGNLVWLASYPFSGNRCLRSFLYCILRKPETAPRLADLRKLSLSDTDPELYEQLSGKPFQQLQPQEVHNLRLQVQLKMTEAHPNPVLIESSNAFATIGDVPLFSAELTAASVYVVRNPLAVVPALAQATGISIEAAIEALAKPDFFPMFARHSLPCFAGRWSDHVNSWARPPWQEHLLLRYEDLRENPVESFGRVLTKFNIDATEQDILEAAELSWLPPPAGPFADLSEEQKQRIIASHRETMQALGYLE
ncbi:MAG: sulfotransferase domain-containing protein [Rhodovibrionaceae bacterium]